MSLLKGISLVICTYNGASRLKPTLEAIFNQEEHHQIPWELIIIDNASTDDTNELCKRLIAQYNFQSKSSIVYEKNPGCNFARPRGLKEARYQWILFCDDDNHLFPNYLKQGWSILQANPTIGVLGGQGVALFEDNAPEWFQRYHLSFAVGRQSSVSGKLNRLSSRKLHSAGSFYRKEVLMQYFEKGFSTIMVGRKGKNLTGGEDTEWCMMIELMRYDLWYDDSLKFYHYMPNGRMNWEYYLKLKKGTTSGEAKLKAYQLFYHKSDPAVIGFCFSYFASLLFTNAVWLQFVVKSSIFREKYSKEILELGGVVNKEKASSYRKDFWFSYHHFLQLKKILKTLLREN
jgi:glycosyltransferase involved in cell wall biosynthesis